MDYKLAQPSMDTIKQVVELARQGKDAPTSELFSQILSLLTPDQKLAPAPPRLNFDSHFHAVINHIDKVECTSAYRSKAQNFHGLESVRNVLAALVSCMPYFPAFTDFVAGRPTRSGLSKTKLYERAASFVSDTKKRVRSTTEMPSTLLDTETRNDIIPKDNKFLHDATHTLCSSCFVCAGNIFTPYRPCANGVVVMDNSKGGEFPNFEADHAVAVIHVGTVYDSIIGDVKYKPELKSVVLEFIQHLMFATCSHSMYGWPPNVYNRCKPCNSDSEKATGQTHEKVWCKPDGSKKIL